ncbi:hypothetical protein AB205_0129960 [Aquarana catesbeiana]|uniref:Uncharacterized protein n=2 Tax=Aquarana catesbeiana TaxID=8400 RepID=A0A2G9RY80_AQUCT|nr:hypothetical protein AB205_0129960 [Aquarana catesbeiana]
MEEIPVAQTHLGSSSMTENLFLTPRSPRDLANECEHGLRQSWPVTAQKFELLPKVPTVFVSESSGELLSSRTMDEPKAQDTHCTRYNTMWMAKGKGGEQVLSISNAEVSPSINTNR